MNNNKYTNIERRKKYYKILRNEMIIFSILSVSFLITSFIFENFDVVSELVKLSRVMSLFFLLATVTVLLILFKFKDLRK